MRVRKRSIRFHKAALLLQLHGVAVMRAVLKRKHVQPAQLFLHLFRRHNGGGGHGVEHEHIQPGSSQDSYKNRRK